MDTTTEDPATRRDWWRDPLSLTEADKARLATLSDRELEALDVTSDEHEYVWGFRQDRPGEARLLTMAQITASRYEWDAKTAAAGHSMTWDLEDAGPGQLAVWYGRCGNCGATMDIFSGGTSIGRGALCARDVPCKGPGTAWQEEMVHDLQRQRVAEAVAQFGQDVKDHYDKAWLRDQGFEEV